MLKFETRLFKMSCCLMLIFCCFITLFADGLPGEYYVTQRWRDLFAGHTPTTNPAFMTEENYVSTRFALSPTLQNAFLLMEAGAIIPIGLYQSIGLSYSGLSARRGIAHTTSDPKTGKIQFVGDTLNDDHGLITLSYAINPANKLSIGANLSMFFESNFGDAMMGMTFDLALGYRVARHAFLGDHIIGMSLQNAVSPDFGFSSFTNHAANLKISWLAKIWEKRIEAGVDLDVKDIFSQAPNDFVSEGSKKIEIDVNARIGLWLLRMINVYFQVGSEYIGMAGGLNIPTVNKGRDFQIMYQYTSIVDDVDLTAAHTMYFRGDFGLHREEIYARKMARLASVGPGNLWNIAMTLFSKGKYWDAMFVFGKILTNFPDFFKNDQAHLYLSLCEENMDMRSIPFENFNIIKQQYPQSAVVPHADLGLLRVHYRNGNSSGVANQFSKLDNKTTPDSLKFHAYYYMGETFLRDREYDRAIEMFDQIPSNHLEYPFAQHSLAVAAALKDDFDKAFVALNNIISLKPDSKAAEEIINRAFVFIGYIYYEGMGSQKASLSKAISALRRVKSNSYYYQDALLGKAWTSLKAQQFDDCIKATSDLTSVTTDIVNRCEAALLESYCYMVKKDYIKALEILSPAYNLISRAIPPTERSLEVAKEGYDRNRTAYSGIATEANNLAFTTQSDMVVAKIDSLSGTQKSLEKKLNSYYIFTEEFKRRSFFARNIDVISADIEYALAKTEKMISVEEVERIKIEATQKSDEIEAEMKKLEEELKKLESEQE